MVRLQCHINHNRDIIMLNITDCQINQLRMRLRMVFLKGGGANFFRAFINSELGPPEVAPCMARTFGGVSGHRRRTGSKPRPAQIRSQK